MSGHRASMRRAFDARRLLSSSRTQAQIPAAQQGHLVGSSDGVPLVARMRAMEITELGPRPGSQLGQEAVPGVRIDAYRCVPPTAPMCDPGKSYHGP
jgi:hypothetical protein